MADGTVELGQRVATLEEAQRRTNGREKTQDAATLRLESKVDRLLYWLMTEMAALILLAVGVWLKR